MNQSAEIKAMVKDKYGAIARKSRSSCCGPAVTSCCDSGPAAGVNMIGENYNKIKGHVDEADLGLGCGVPTEFADMKPGDTVVDLGSGAGNDVFIARSVVGETGSVIGIDMTEDMVNLANRNNLKQDYKNVSFKLGEIENLPLTDNLADVVISNCVLNLVPDKPKAFAEIHRILKPGGHFCVSDIVLEGTLPDNLRKSAEMYAGCVSGAVQGTKYLDIIRKTGFTNIQVPKRREITIPDDILREYVSGTAIQKLKEKGFGIYSITVTAEK